MTRWMEEPENESNQKQGKNFEELVELSNSQYAKKKIAKILKNEPSVGIVKGSMNGGKFTGFFKEKGKLDYSGCVADGRAIAFDCKSTTREKFHLSSMQKHQVEKIKLGIEVGEVAFVLIQFLLDDEYYICSAKTLLEKYDKHPSGTLKRENLIQVDYSGNLLDYIPAVIKMVKDGL